MTEISLVFDELITTAEAGDWEKFNTELVKKLETVDGNEMAVKLLERVNDPNPDIRDVVASSLVALNINDQGVLSRAIREMVNQADNDKERFPAGRAAMFLLVNRDNKDLGSDIQGGIEKFTGRPEIPEWRNDLIENIPGIDELLK
jgi:hypothetical protein